MTQEGFHGSINHRTATLEETTASTAGYRSYDEKSIDTELAAGKAYDNKEKAFDTASIDQASGEIRKLVRSVITNAKLGGLLEDLNMTEGQYRWCLSIYYFGFILFEIPSNIILRRWRPSPYLSFLVFTWGVVVMCSAAATNFAGLLLSRFRSGYTIILACVAAATGGLIAYGISHITTQTLSTWQWMFIIEGAPCIVLAVICYFYLPDKPETAKFLNERERELALKRLSLDQGAADDHTWSWNQVISVFTDWKSYLYTSVTVSTTISAVGVTLALPSIIAGMGAWSQDVSLALTTPPYVLACIFTFLGCWSSDKLFERGYHNLVGVVIRMMGLLMLMFVPDNNYGARYFAVCIAVASSYMNLPIKVAWYTNNYSGMTRRAVACAFIAGFGAIGSAIAGQVYFDGPLFFWGNTIAFIFLVIEAIITLILRMMLKHVNKARAKMTVEERERQIAKYGGEGLVGDHHPDFRYAL
ncbi:major facilitator superfamily domain-containing protein [Zychaea mexicana]|uniref:major facilitator superfamily domain-containing protein n=1 Tax=Zychaea mexicana TaxID=64656 RepID=UPI0022FE42F1|nr:major facilitator superfamily domain-containing protein [Zychaea mexicana]KAI9491294.1 major facilitator superfamily domain-containing protein [Zychaea mexicana]